MNVRKKILSPTAETSLEIGSLLSYAYLESRHSLRMNLLKINNKVFSNREVSYWIELNKTANILYTQSIFKTDYCL